MNEYEFDFSLYTDKKYCMICEKPREVEAFSLMLDEQGLKWCNGRSYIEETHYCKDVCDNGCVFCFNEGKYSSYLSDYTLKNYDLLYFKDFSKDTKFEYNIKIDSLL